MRILIVDDHLCVAQLCSSVLAGEHEKVGIEIKGGNVLPRIRRGGYDGVLLDLVLPDIDGIEVLADIKRAHPHVKVIATTGWDVAELRVRAMKNGADAFVPKAQGLTPLRSALRWPREGPGFPTKPT
jgi:two-component system OmpR family response regulator